MEIEEAKRQAALDRAAAEAGETRWVLNFDQVHNVEQTLKTPIKVIQAGFATIDHDRTPATVRNENSGDGELLRPALAGRKSFGKFNRTIEVGINMTSYH